MRDCGYLILDDVLKDIGADTTSLDTVVKSDKVTLYKTSNTTFSFNYNDIEYYCKFNMKYSPYNELVACSLLKDFKLVTVEYDLATIAGQKGVYCCDFHVANRKYINGYDLVKEANNNYGNNLEDIWSALIYHYKDSENKEEIVAHLMDKIIDLFIFDIFIDNSDRCGTNFQIMEGEDLYDIAPIYDCERLLDNKDNDLPINSISVTPCLFSESPYKVLEEFLSYSDSSYLDRVKEKLWIIGEDNINSVLERIEKKTNYPMDPVLMVYYLEGFRKHREKIEEIINKYERKR